MNLQTVMIVAMVLTSSLALAQGGDFVVGNGSDGLSLSYARAETYAAPQPLPDSKAKIRFSDLKASWDQGLPLNEKILIGRWKLVASMTTANCSTMAPSAYNPKGFKFKDGTSPGLEFKKITKRGDDFTGRPESEILTVTLVQAEGKHQGPYEVNHLEPLFAQWTYTRLENGYTYLNRDSYLEYSCRGVAGNPSKMICGGALKILEKTYSNQVLSVCERDGVGIMLGYTKEK